MAQLFEPKDYCVQYPRILLSSFEEEDFQKFALNLLCIIYGYYFANNVGGGATI